MTPTPRPVSRIVVLTLAGVALSGCALFRPAPGPDLTAIFGESDGRVAMQDTRFAFALEETAPVATQAPAPVPEAPMDVADAGQVPILVIGQTEGPLRSADHGATRRLAQFLCAERPDWPRAEAAERPRDWMAEGRWHIVDPCAGPAVAESGMPLSPFRAPAGADPILSTQGTAPLRWPWQD